jgi:hypothetical protein
VRLAKALFIALPIAVMTWTGERSGHACGGCFPPPPPPFMQGTETGLVAGHRMILSVAQAQTTLWDQISYTGNPSDFAWVLPIKGQVTVGISSDALFETLEAQTAPTVVPPPANCSAASSGANGAGGAVGFTPPPTVIAQEVVGPYQTVQLSSQNAGALETWLLQNGYNIPADIAPIIQAYVSEGFDFLAIKLVPGQGVSAMKPVRVTAPGAGLSLPLRMVSAGTGASVTLKAWIFGEGRYAPTNFASFTIDPKSLVWNYTTQSSNYSTLEQAGYDANMGKAWLVESARPFDGMGFAQQLESLAQTSPVQSGYADAMGQGADTACTDDMTTLFGSIPATSLWVTRLKSSLVRAGLATDLVVGASTDQTPIYGSWTAASSLGSPCGGGPEGVTSGAGAGGTGGHPAGGVGSPSSCTVDGAGLPASAAPLALFALLALARARSRSRR